jgi:hypothetical protein
MVAVQAAAGQQQSKPNSFTTGHRRIIMRAFLHHPSL